VAIEFSRVPITASRMGVHDTAKRAPTDADAPRVLEAESPLLLLYALLVGVIPHLASFLAVLLICDS
jgi:hypothetical protein